MCWLDFMFFEMTETFFLAWPFIEEEFPALGEYRTAFRNHAGIKEYLESDRNIDRHRAFNNTQAKINSHVSYTLHYFPVYGRGEPVRMLLAHAGLDYIDH